MNIKVEKFLKFSWLILFPFISTYPVEAAEWSVDADIRQDISYDDNVRMRENDKKGSFIYNVSPTINFARKTDVSEISANASYGFEHFFSDISGSDGEQEFEKNRHTQKYGINGRYSMTERIDWGLSADYSIAPARDTAQEDSGLFDTNSDRTAYSISPSVSYKLTEQDSLELSAGYSEANYSDVDIPDHPTAYIGRNQTINRLLSRPVSVPVSGQTQIDNDSLALDNWISSRVSEGILNDYEDINLGLRWSRLWSERFESSVGFSYSRYESERYIPKVVNIAIHEGEPDENGKEPSVESLRLQTNFRGRTELTTSDTYSITLSSRYMLFENWEIYGEGGGRYTKVASDSFDNNIKIITIDRDGDDFGFVFDVGTLYTGESLSADFSIGQEVAPSPRGPTEERFRVGLDLNYEITERLSTALVSSYQKSNPVNDSSSERERINFSIQPSLSWKLTPDWMISTSYRYQYQERPIGGTNEKANSNVYMISLNYRWQGLRVSR